MGCCSSKDEIIDPIIYNHDDIIETSVLETETRFISIENINNSMEFVEKEQKKINESFYSKKLNKWIENVNNRIREKVKLGKKCFYLDFDKDYFIDENGFKYFNSSIKSFYQDRIKIIEISNKIIYLFCFSSKKICFCNQENLTLNIEDFLKRLE
jgi:hypothetical protein